MTSVSRPALAANRRIAGRAASSAKFRTRKSKPLNCCGYLAPIELYAFSTGEPSRGEASPYAFLALPGPSMEEFPRIQRLPPYVFNVTGELKLSARRHGEDVIDF